MTTDACTLPTIDRPLRVAEFDALFTTAVTRVDRGQTTVRLHLSGPPGLSDLVRDLTGRESSCCSFFSFTLAGSDESLILDITVPAERRDILASLADRAEELSR